MTIEQLREFLVLAEIGNYQRAANALYISQATLSRHILSLEQELGIVLFTRLPQISRLSEAGVHFLPHARRIVELADESISKIQQRSCQAENTLTFAVFHNFNFYKIANLLTSFARAYPNIKINVIEQNTNSLTSLLQDCRCNFAFVDELGSAINDGFSREYFCEDILAAILPAFHPLAQCESISLGQLKDEKLIISPQRGTLFDICLIACNRAGFNPSLAYSVSGNSIFEFIGSGLCAALLLKTPATYMHDEKTCLVDIVPHIHVSINLLYQKRDLTVEEICFLEFFRSRKMR